MSVITTHRQVLPLVLLGAGGHAKVLLSIARLCGQTILGVCDPVLSKQGVTDWRGIKVLGDDRALDQLDPSSVALINGIGQLAGRNYRRELHQNLANKGYHFATLIHPTAYLDVSVKLGCGVQIMAGVVIQTDTVIGDGTIINSQALVEHDCFISRYVHIAPGATMCGEVNVHEGAFVGSGAVVIQGISIGENAVVGAGATLTSDIAAGDIAVGPRLCRR